MHDRRLARLRQLACDLGTSYRLGTDESESLTLVYVALALVRGGDRPADLPFLDGVAAALTDRDVLEAATGCLGVAGFGLDDDSDRSAHALFAAVAARSPATAGAHVALARSCEAVGDVVAMERSLHHALRLDADHRLAHDDLGDLASLRGEFRAAARHFDRAGRPPVGLAAVAANLGWGPIRGGRNEYCPCGSGVRYKRCCLPTDGWPLDARVAMLPTRIADWADRPVWFRRRLRFAGAAVGVAEAEAEADRLVAAALAPGMIELHLFEGGGIGRLAAEVGAVLRADERDVLAGWAHSRHDLYEVVGRGTNGTTLLLGRTGETRCVRGVDHDLLEAERPLVLAVLLPCAPSTGGGDWVLGGDPIPLDPDCVQEVRDILDTHRDPTALTRAAITPVLEFQRLTGTSAPPDDAERDARLRWLFGDGVDIRRLGGLGAIDDVVTTVYMRGGGFTVAADHIRSAARHIAAAEPPEVWALAQQLTVAGHDRQTVLVHVACAWAAATRWGPDPAAVRAAYRANLSSVPARIAADQPGRRRNGPP